MDATHICRDLKVLESYSRVMTSMHRQVRSYVFLQFLKCVFQDVYLKLSNFKNILVSCTTGETSTMWTWSGKPSSPWPSARQFQYASCKHNEGIECRVCMHFLATQKLKLIVKGKFNIISFNSLVTVPVLPVWETYLKYCLSINFLKSYT